MIDIRLIREHPELVKEGLLTKRCTIDLEEIVRLDQEYRQLLVKVEALRNQKNTASDEIAKMVRDKIDPKQKIASMKGIVQEIDQLEHMEKELAFKLKEKLLYIPNLPHSSVPGETSGQNQIIRSWGTKQQFKFSPKSHIELAEILDIIDFKRAAKISGSNFILYKAQGAQMVRALYNFMLDVHTQEHHYKEVFPPFLVNRTTMTGTGQLPKMEEDMYRLKDEDLFLIPTAEVPVTNIYQDEILRAEDLPILLTAYTACFRREAGSYGKETKGLNRVHQFDKVELVKFVKPSDSYAELESLVNHAESILQRLGLPYRVAALAGGDLSFAAAKCYDLEVYTAGLDKWLEVSSCSNFEEFQARRANIRFRSKETNKTAFVHTLNGSGVALPRTIAAILENYQTPLGEVVIPEVLRPYMGGRDIIKKP